MSPSCRCDFADEGIGLSEGWIVRGARTREKGEREGKEGEERKEKQIKTEIQDVDREKGVTMLEVT